MVWVFTTPRSRFPGAVFTSRALAETWISKHNLIGTLTRYPLDQGVYEWAIEHRCFVPSEEQHRTREFIGGFTTASQEHYHYGDGDE